MHRGRHWSFEPLRQPFRQGFWKTQSNQIIVSEAVDAKFGLKPNSIISFKKVESYVDEFVEEFVPRVVDSLYR